MTMQTSSIAIPTPRRGPGRFVLGLAAAAVVVAMGAGLWQIERDGGTSDTTRQPATATSVERAAVARPAETATTVYVVGSQAQADGMRAAIAEADAIRAAVGETPLVDQVMVVTDAEADTFLRMMGEQDATRAALGLPSMSVIDLRSASSAGATTPADSRGGLGELIGEGGTPASLGAQS